MTVASLLRFEHLTRRSQHLPWAYKPQQNVPAASLLLSSSWGMLIIFLSRSESDLPDRTCCHLICPCRSRRLGRMRYLLRLDRAAGLFRPSYSSFPPRAFFLLALELVCSCMGRCSQEMQFLCCVCAVVLGTIGKELMGDGWTDVDGRTELAVRCRCWRLPLSSLGLFMLQPRSFNPRSFKESPRFWYRSQLFRQRQPFSLHLNVNGGILCVQHCRSSGS